MSADPYAAMAREFLAKMGKTVRDTPDLGTPAERGERIARMLEELLEVARALGVSVLWADEHPVWNVSDFKLRADGTEPDTACALRELADLQVTVSGTTAMFGLPLLQAVREVHRANMEKLPSGPLGKPTKPDGWKPPDVTGLVAPRRPRVIVESPYAGDVERNRAYLAAALRDCLRRGEAPFASHGLYTLPGVLDDTNPEERETGISAGFAYHKVAARVAVYTDLGLSPGMKRGIANAAGLALPVEYRTLPGWDTRLPLTDRSACLASDECGVLCQEQCTVKGNVTLGRAAAAPRAPAAPPGFVAATGAQGRFNPALVENVTLGLMPSALQEAPGAMLRQLAGADPSQPVSVVLPAAHQCPEPCLGGIDCDCVCHEVSQ